jgi:uncharacterized membrane protein YfcA
VDHSAVDVVLLIVAGLAAGVVNALAGGGSLLTFAIGTHGCESAACAAGAPAKSPATIIPDAANLK